MERLVPQAEAGSEAALGATVGRQRELGAKSCEQPAVTWLCAPLGTSDVIHAVDQHRQPGSLAPAVLPSLVPSLARCLDSLAHI
jgi:hypothetical protein